MSLRSKHSKDYHNYLSTVIENELTNQSQNNAKLWISMGEELEIESIPKTKISTIIRKDIEDKLFESQNDIPREECKYHSGYFFRIMKCQGWINPNMARNVSDDNVDPLGDQKIVPCANPKMKAISYDLINLCRIIVDKSKDGIPFEDTFGDKKMNEFYKQMHTIINNCKNTIDHKTKIPKNSEIFLLDCLGTVLGSVNKCAEIFMEQKLSHLKEQGKFFTLKQATKFQKGMRQSQQFILKPPTRDMALFLDYTGIQCKCGSFRVRQKQDSYKLECYDCDSIIPHGHVSKCNGCKVPLYKERLIHIVKTGKCENCNEIVVLPQELIDYAKS